MSKSKQEIKASYPLCYSVAFCKSSYFRSHAWQVQEDEEFIKDLIKNKKYKELVTMEAFYSELRKNRTPEKDISSKFRGKSVSYEELILKFKNK